MESQRLMQTMVPNNSAYFHGMCEDLGIEIDTCHGDADAFYDNDGRCKVCTLPVNRHSIPQTMIDSWSK